MDVLQTPAVLVDLDKLEANIADMAAFSRETQVSLRPHIKAHKTVQIARKQLEAGACGLTVATLREAEVMAEAGIRDIFIACQIAGPEKVERLSALAASADLTVAVDSLPGARILAAVAKKSGRNLSVLMEINTGLDRCGVLPGEDALQLARSLIGIPGLTFKGIFTHAGQVYAATARSEVEKIGRHEGRVMVETAELLRRFQVAVEVVSVGSTPTVKISGRVDGVTEIRPGNYVFYDAIQVGLGVASQQQCALSVLAAVISKPAPGRIIVDAGSKTLALDRGAHGAEIVGGFGLIPEAPAYKISRLSEEHGIIDTTAASGPGPDIGERIEIIPNHACVVANLAEKLHLRQKGRPVDTWPVAARGR